MRNLTISLICAGIIFEAWGLLLMITEGVTLHGIALLASICFWSLAGLWTEKGKNSDGS